MCHWISNEGVAEMIELNLLEKKQPMQLPTVLGVDLNTLNFKMIIFSVIVYYVPGIFIDSHFQELNAEIQTALDQVTSENSKLAAELKKDENIKTQLSAYKAQVEKLKSRSAQVDEILKRRTNPKKILEKIARSIPEDLWFNEMEINDKNEVTIYGGSYTPRAIGEFITIINDSPYFGGSIIPSKQENKQEMIDGINTSYESYELKGKIINYDMRSK